MNKPKFEFASFNYSSKLIIGFAFMMFVGRLDSCNSYNLICPGFVKLIVSESTMADGYGKLPIVFQSQSSFDTIQIIMRKTEIRKPLKLS